MGNKRKLKVQQAEIGKLKFWVAKLKSDMAKLNANVAVLASMDYKEPQPKLLDQSVFEGQDEKWRFAAVDEDSRAFKFDCEPAINCDEWYEGNGQQKVLIGTGYDTNRWLNSLIERESKELTGSDLCRAMLARGDKAIMCAVSDKSDDAAIAEGRYEVVDGFTSDGMTFNTIHSYWENVVPVNNKGEPLTGKEVGL